MRPVLLTLSLLLLAVRATGVETISLDEINPGDRGEWRTVVSGSEVESFPLTVVGVLDSFAGPGLPILLCRADDEVNRNTGPVSGMSGSPVYIDGRLAGAYAYGFPWSKEKTLIGVTPIEWMMPLLDYPDHTQRETPASAGPSSGQSSASLGIPDDFSAVAVRAGRATSPQALPIPLLASGVSANVLEALRPWLEGRNLSVTAGAGGRADRKAGELKAGSPLAVILASGDLTLGGVGTVTYREGDRLLAFGHPMLGSGSVELPIGGAEIVDVVSSYRISFKLSNIGEVSGTLWQDSTPGIQGELGRIPYMIPITVRSNAGIKTPIEGKLAEHRQLTPTMALIYAAQAILTANEGPDDATLRGTLRLSLEDEEEPLEFSRVGVGFGGAIDVLFTFAEAVDLVLNGSQEFPRLSGLEYDFTTELREKRQILHSIRLESARIEAGESVHLTVITRNRTGEAVQHAVEIPLPPAPRGSSFSIFVADADALRSYDQIAQRDPTRPLSELVTELRQLRDNGSIYVQLLRPNTGLRLEGRNLEDLPPSVIRLYQTSLEQPGEMLLKESVVWETSIPVPGVFSGSSRIEFTTEP